MRNRFDQQINRKDPDLLTPGQLVDLVKQREQYLQELNLSYTNYMPFENEVQIPVPRENEIIDSKLASFYRYIEDLKEHDRRQKLKKNPQTNQQSIEGHFSLAQMEMGIKGDGQAYQASSGGLGYVRDEEDIYSKFRKQKSQAYYGNFEGQKYKK